MKSRSLSTPVVVLFTVIAFVMGSVSVATAAALTKADVKSIAKKQIAKKAPGLSVAKAATATSVAPNGVNSAAIADGSVAAADIASGVVPVTLFARVATGGALTFGKGAVSSTRNSTGNYTVTFDRPVNNCVAAASPFGDQRVMYVTQPAGNTMTIDWELNDGTQGDTTFNLIVLC